MSSDVVTRRLFIWAVAVLAAAGATLKATGYAGDGIELELAAPGVFLVLDERRAMIVSIPDRGTHKVAEGSYVHATLSSETMYYEVDIPECGTFKLAGSSGVVDCGNCDVASQTWSCPFDPASLSDQGWKLIRATAPRLTVRGTSTTW